MLVGLCFVPVVSAQFTCTPSSDPLFFQTQFPIHILISLPSPSYPTNLAFVLPLSYSIWALQAIFLHATCPDLLEGAYSSSFGGNTTTFHVYALIGIVTGGISFPLVSFNMWLRSIWCLMEAG
ncbi:hypothetical protein ACFX2C_028388 [Malus domestica]